LPSIPAPGSWSTFEASYHFPDRPRLWDPYRVSGDRARQDADSYSDPRNANDPINADAEEVDRSRALLKRDVQPVAATG
jgi:hypothetical protein